MAKSTYISENLNEDQIEFLKYLNDHEILYFRIGNLQRQLPEHLKKINDLVENLYQKGLLNRVERGTYVIPSYQNTKVLATFISKNSSIAYWSALHYHGLTERFPNTVFVKTTQRKRDTEILGTAVKFVTVKEQKNMGRTREGYGDDSFLITDVEMTLVDCFDQNRYSGGFPELIKAFAGAKLTNKKLIDYTKVYSNTALTKRMGFLAELFHRKRLERFINYTQSRINTRYNLIDAGGLEEGTFINEWKLRLNVGKESLVQMAQSVY